MYVTSAQYVWQKRIYFIKLYIISIKYVCFGTVLHSLRYVFAIFVHNI